MKDNVKVPYYISRVIQFINEMKLCGETLSDERIIEVRYVIIKESKAWDWSKSQSNFGVVLTSEDTLELKGFEDESESEDDSEGNSEGEFGSEGESESEDEFDSDPDSDGDSDSSEDPDSGNILDSEDGHASKGGTFGVPTSDNVPASEEDSEQVHMLQRIRQISRRFEEIYEFEGESYSDGDSASKDESESDGDSESEDESESDNISEAE
ncbi:uncharacterized protein LOC127082271 [Lathyrus oleraceus]|uniref:uncharacterized protein LOC127082271 n=1 Tax=Pisum sativum TaxID=3888 RepID=UPI0021D2A7C5|nr:uncharacterized protein LOC127082271 [Pisum sativum]